MRPDRNNISVQGSVVVQALIRTAAATGLAIASCAQGQGGFALPTSNGASQQGGVTNVPVQTLFVLRQTAIVFEELTLNDKAAIVVAPGIREVQITCKRLTLHGESTFSLVPGEDYADPATLAIPLQPPKQPQAKPRTDQQPYEQAGATGRQGLSGRPGLPGVTLKLNVLSLDATDGSLWIQTDGGMGKPGGQGGDGGKGSSGPFDLADNPDGGNGGDGGKGGVGGTGGNSAKVVLSLQDAAISPTRAPGIAPSNRPAEAKLPGRIVIYGAPGPGGRGGSGGSGGAGGEGHTCHWPCTNSKAGRYGSDGHKGDDGAAGSFSP